MAAVEIAAPLIEPDIQGIIYTRCETRLGRYNIVDIFREDISAQQRKSFAEAFVHAELGAVIPCPIIISQQAALRVEQSQSLRIQHAFIGVLGRGWSAGKQGILKDRGIPVPVALELLR